ncbi:YlxR family protein [Ligilactobacillus salivarius]|uniref:RNase P modulator RnpM n=1 Tax=Ligilactobacillus salivarius TaxID=1624 RepID=UPI003977590B
MAQRKIPMRKDIVTGEMVPKKELVRVVKNKEDEVSIDPSGKKSGRGAYIHLNVDVAKKAKVDKTFDKTFGISISDDFYDELIAYVDHQVERAKLFGNGK